MSRSESGRAALVKGTRHATMTEEGRPKGREIVRDHLEDTQENLARRTGEAEQGKGES